MSRLRVLVTGAAGYIAAQLLPAFRERYELTLIDLRTHDAEGRPVKGVQVVDLLREREEALALLFQSVDVVVHLAYVRPESSDPRVQYEAERANVDMMQRVYQLSLDNGVRRVVAASTNQAAKWYEQPWSKRLKNVVTPEDYPRPDSFYGWAKAAYESLGFVYACGALGRKLEVVQIRIVAPREIRARDYVDKPLFRYLRDLAGYVSPRDLQQLFCRSIETPNIEDEHGVPFHIFYGVSNNARKFWSIVNARRVVGYAPEDDSEVLYADEIRQMLGSGERAGGQ